jgi:Nitrate reductase delta subunit
MNSLELTPEVRQLLSEAAEWRILELLFQCPTPDWRDRIAELRPECKDADLTLAIDIALEIATEGAYHSIMGPGGPAPAREASYIDTMQLGYLMSELNAIYEAFGFRPETSEIADHVSVQAGFMGYLRLKQAFAAAAKQDEQAALVRDNAAIFVRDHLSHIAEPMSAALEACGYDYLVHAGKALLHRTGPAEKRVFEILDQELDAWTNDSLEGCETI